MAVRVGAVEGRASDPLVDGDAGFAGPRSRVNLRKNMSGRREGCYQ
jgi:hypothetical protein